MPNNVRGEFFFARFTACKQIKTNRNQHPISHILTCKKKLLKAQFVSVSLTLRPCLAYLLCHFFPVELEDDSDVEDG